MAAVKLDFLNLEYLLVQEKVSAAVLAKVIEDKGIFGVDQHGRCKHFAAGSNEAKQALEALAAQYAWRTRAAPPSYEEPEPLESAIWEDRFQGYGWQRAVKPDFKAIKPHDVSPQSTERELGTRERTNLLNLVGALLEFIRGKYTEKQHPGFENQEQLAQLLWEKTRAPGLSPDNLEKVFAAANKAIKEARER